MSTPSTRKHGPSLLSTQSTSTVASSSSLGSDSLLLSGPGKSSPLGRKAYDLINLQVCVSTTGMMFDTLATKLY